MTRTLMATAALLCMTASLRAETYELENWPADIDNIPCSAWSKAADGTWVLNGSVKIGASVIENVGVKGSAAAHALDRKCGK